MTIHPTIRRANADDTATLLAFLYDHGVNEWNHLPEGPIRAHLAGIAAGTSHAVVAEQDGRLIGFVSLELGRDMARYQPAERQGEVHGIVHEAVVHREHCGQGIGTRLLTEAVKRIAELGCRDVYVARHAENLGSAGMMRKAGFAVIDEYDDPRRTSGNRRTAVSHRAIDADAGADGTLPDGPDVQRGR